MYWCRSKNIAGVILTVNFLAVISLSACKHDKEVSTLKFFDLKGYFKADSIKLTKLNRQVFKTVIHNKNSETKSVHIDNWGNELRLFGESDINKPAWKDSYLVENTANTLVYKAKYPELETREITINKVGDKVKRILIINHTRNLLYETREKLTYVPDSMYRIEKTQQVRLLGINRYDIRGVLN